MMKKKMINEEESDASSLLDRINDQLVFFHMMSSNILPVDQALPTTTGFVLYCLKLLLYLFAALFYVV